MIFPSGPSARLEPSKTRLSLPPTWYHGDRYLVVPGDRGKHVVPELAFPQVERRSGDVQQNLPSRPDEIFDRVDAIQPAVPEVLVVPGVFADGEGAGSAIETEQFLLVGGCKVPLLVEYVIGGQQSL